jgi:hypothetical protein
MKINDREEICCCIREEIQVAINDFKFDIQDYVKNAIDALKANTEVGVRAIRKLDDISKQLEEFD